MRNFIAAILCVLLVCGASLARADFKYSDTSKITGGTMKGMMKTVGMFSKQASQAMKPVTTTRYLKGDFMRSDEADGKVQIIDLAGRRIIHIDSQQHTYTEMTFDEMKAAMQKAQEQAQQKMDKDPKKQDVQASMNAKISVTPGTGSRQIQGMTANEMKVQIDMEIQAQQQNQQAGQPNQPVSGTISTSIDSWVAPSVPGYEEVSEFYKRMAKEINWVPPSGIRVDPRVSQSMDELQKNQAAFKGLPLLQYLSMTMVGQQGAAANGADNGSGSNANANSSSTSGSDTPTSASDAMVKGLGGLFGKKKKKDEAAEQQNSQNPPPPSTPGALIEMTIEVTSFSNAALDASLFAIPAGYTRVQQNPDQILKQQGKP
jgi:hypothetical protein